MAALSRMANRDHQIRIVEGDTVILASSLIPGNENAVYRVINGLTRWGANVVHKGNAKVHVSGHASAGELLYFYNICKPHNLMPIHGEWRHLRANAELGQLTGIPQGAHASSPRTASSSTSSTASPRSPARSRPAMCTSTACRSATSPSPRSRTAASSARRASSRSSWWSTARTGKIVGGPNIHARGSGIEDDGVRRRHPQDRGGAVPFGLRRRHGDPADPAAHPPLGRQVGLRHLPPAPDDPAGRRRGLTSPDAPSTRLRERAAGFASGGPLQYVGTTASTSTAETCVLEKGLVIPTGKHLIKSETRRRESPEGP